MSKPRKIRLGHRDLWALLNAASGWMEIVITAEQGRRAERLMAFGLVRSPKPKEIHDGVYGLKLTPLGGAVAAFAARARGQKLRRRGVQLLAKHRKRILERFDLERALVGLEHSYRVHLENQVRKALSAHGEASR